MMVKSNNPNKKLTKSRQERLKIALKANMAKRKAQAEARVLDLTDKKNIKFKLED